MRNFLFNIFIFASHVDSGPQTGSKTVPSGRFLCGFNIMDYLKSLHVVDQTVGRCGQWPHWLAGLAQRPWYPQLYYHKLTFKIYFIIVFQNLKCIIRKL